MELKKKDKQMRFKNFFILILTVMIVSPTQIFIASNDIQLIYIDRIKPKKSLLDVKITFKHSIHRDHSTIKENLPSEAKTVIGNPHVLDCIKDIEVRYSNTRKWQRVETLPGYTRLDKCGNNNITIKQDGTGKFYISVNP
ncbi:MAG: hypothetical protein WDZ41_02935 [Candidatus Babeliales bacterium]